MFYRIRMHAFADAIHALARQNHDNPWFENKALLAATPDGWGLFAPPLDDVAWRIDLPGDYSGSAVEEYDAIIIDLKQAKKIFHKNLWADEVVLLTKADTPEDVDENTTHILEYECAGAKGTLRCNFYAEVAEQDNGTVLKTGVHADEWLDYYEDIREFHTIGSIDGLDLLSALEIHDKIRSPYDNRPVLTTYCVAITPSAVEIATADGYRLLTSEHAIQGQIRDVERFEGNGQLQQDITPDAAHEFMMTANNVATVMRIIKSNKREKPAVNFLRNNRGYALQVLSSNLNEVLQVGLMQGSFPEYRRIAVPWDQIPYRATIWTNTLRNALKRLNVYASENSGIVQMVADTWENGTVFEATANELGTLTQRLHFFWDDGHMPDPEFYLGAAKLDYIQDVLSKNVDDQLQWGWTSPSDPFTVKVIDQEDLKISYLQMPMQVGR